MPLFGPPNVEKLKANGDAPGLRKALEHPGHWRVRRDAAEALGRIGDASAVACLVAALRDDTSSVRQAAAEALGQIRDISAAGPLMALLKDQSLAVAGLLPRLWAGLGIGGRSSPSRLLSRMRAGACARPSPRLSATFLTPAPSRSSAQPPESGT